VKKFWLIIFGLFIFRLILAFGPHHPDLWNHMDWGERFFQYGALGFYNPDANVWDFTWPNQPILTIYLYAGIWQLYNFIFSIFWKINITIAIFPSIVITFFEQSLYKALLKLPSILADFGIAYYIYHILGSGKSNKSKHLGRAGALVFLLNPVVWYNSSVWGQTDSVINFLGLASFYYLNKRQHVKSMLFLTLSLLLKISLLIFVPIYILVLIKQKASYKKVIIGIMVSLIGSLILAIPFSEKRDPISFLYWLYSEKVLGQQLQVITANAFNLWAGITGINEQPHTLKFIVISYQYWGYILFGLFTIPIIYKLYKSKQDDYLYWILAITAFSSFMFLTNMHERYLYPLFPYLTLLAVKYKNLFLILIITSLINLINLYHLWWVPKIEIIIKLMSVDDKILPRILGIVLFGVYLWFYRYTFRQKA